MIGDADRLSMATLFRAFPAKIAITWGLTLLETVMYALLPLLIGWSIDGLLADNWDAFLGLITALAALIVVATSRRVYDTRAYGSMRVALGEALARRSLAQPVSVSNARLQMGRELVDFLEETAPLTLTATVQIAISLLLLLNFHSALALSAGATAVLTVLIYALFSRHFFRINSELNSCLERQVSILESRDLRALSMHLLGLRRAEVRLSDMESLVYGLIFTVLLSMLAFNLWFAATQAAATPGQIFAIVSYSFEFVETAVVLPAAFEDLTRLKEITGRLNRNAPQGDAVD